MKKFLLTLALLTGSTFISSAITPQDLDGKVVVQLFYGTIFYGYNETGDFHTTNPKTQLFPTLCCSGKFRYDANANQLYIDNFRGHFTLPVTLSNNQLTIDFGKSFNGNNDIFRTGKLMALQGKHMDAIFYNFNGNYEILRYNGLPAIYQYDYTTINYCTTINGYYAACYSPLSDNSMTATYETGILNSVNLPHFQFYTNNKAFGLELNDSDYNFAAFSSIQMFILNNPSAVAHDTYNGEYNLELELQDENTLLMKNLFNSGFRYQFNTNTGSSVTSLDYSLKWLSANVDRVNHTLTIKTQPTGGMIQPAYYGRQNWWGGQITNTIHAYKYNSSLNPTGTIDLVQMANLNHEKTTTDDYTDSYKVFWDGYWFSTEVYQLNRQQLASSYDYDGGNNKFESINGSYDIERTYHDSPDHKWAHTSNGNLHTYEDWNIHLNEARFYNQAADLSELAKYGLETDFGKTEIEANRLDVTHHATVTLNHYGYGETGNGKGKYIYVNGTVNREKHSHNVTGYEIYLVPGTYSSPTGADFNHENGHVKAINITDYITDFVPNTGGSKAAALAEATAPTADELNAGDKFNLLVPESAFGNDANTNGKYTLFVKALYNDNVNKAAQHNDNGTFHALTQLSTITTGVTDMIYNAENSSIKVADGAIVIEGSEGKALVSTTAGVVVYQGGDNTVNVAPGMYIVRANNTVKRVLVK